MTGEIPPSSALVEIPEGNLAEAIARFDTHVQHGTQNSPDAKLRLRQIIAANRAQRTRWEAAAAADPGGRAPSKGTKIPLGKKIAASMEDLGL